MIDDNVRDEEVYMGGAFPNALMKCLLTVWDGVSIPRLESGSGPPFRCNGAGTQAIHTQALHFCAQ